MSLKHLEEAEQLFKGDFIGLTLWSDGVPVSWDRSESIQCWTWHLHGSSRRSTGL